MVTVIKLCFSVEGEKVCTAHLVLLQEYKAEQKILGCKAASGFCVAIHEIQKSCISLLFLLLLLLLLLFHHNYSSGYTECGVSIIFGIVIVNDSVCPCLPVTESSHKLSGDLLQQHFVMS